MKSKLNKACYILSAGLSRESTAVLTTFWSDSTSRFSSTFCRRPLATCRSACTCPRSRVFSWALCCRPSPTGPWRGRHQRARRAARQDTSRRKGRLTREGRASSKRSYRRRLVGLQQARLVCDRKEVREVGGEVWGQWSAEGIGVWGEGGVGVYRNSPIKPPSLLPKAVSTPSPPPKTQRRQSF